MRRAIYAVAALATGAAGQGTRPPTCDPDYDCAYTFVDNAGTLYEFDFTHLCSTMGRNTNDTAGHQYSFNLCGNSPRECLPNNYHEAYAMGTAIQFYGTAPPCNLTAPECTDPYTGQPRCCTQTCEVLGVGTPLWALQDPSNPSSGGVNITYTGVQPLNDDTAKCGINPQTGAQYARTVTYQVNCDPTVSVDHFEVDAVLADAAAGRNCAYVVQGRTGAACGCTPDCYGKSCGSDGCGGFCSGPDMGGECPGVDVCQSDQTCCRPDCTNRDCGDDGCGGSCGGCGSDQICSSVQVCVSNPGNAAPQAATIVYEQAHGALFGMWFLGVVVSAAVGGGTFFLATTMGRLTLARYRAGGFTSAYSFLAAGSGAEDAAGLVKADSAAAPAVPVATASTGLASGSASKFGGYGGL